MSHLDRPPGTRVDPRRGRSPPLRLLESAPEKSERPGCQPLRAQPPLWSIPLRLEGKRDARGVVLGIIQLGSMKMIFGKRSTVLVRARRGRQPLDRLLPAGRSFLRPHLREPRDPRIRILFGHRRELPSPPDLLRRRGLPDPGPRRGAVRQEESRTWTLLGVPAAHHPMGKTSAVRLDF